MTAPAQNIVAPQILALLAAKHAGDVFVPECKSGPTHFGSHDRIDAWVMPKSWAHPDVIGYEIKVSRSDFLRDDKWTRYLDLCNLLYFVAPRKLIDPSELPTEVGLIEVSGTGSRLLTKRKAARRNVQIPEDVWRYILMCRTKITREVEPKSQVEYWREWMEGKHETQKLGRSVSKRLKDQYEADVVAVQEENRILRDRITAVDKAEKALIEMGVDLDSWHVEHAAREVIRKERGELTQAAARAIERAMRELEILLRMVSP